jgi:hypothetical protein
MPSSTTTTLPVAALSRLQRHIFICVSDKSKCAQRPVQDTSWHFLKRRVKELSLATRIGRSRVNCFQHTCTVQGPVACVFCSHGAT